MSAACSMQPPTCHAAALVAEHVQRKEEAVLVHVADAGASDVVASRHELGGRHACADAHGVEIIGVGADRRGIIGQELNGRDAVRKRGHCVESKEHLDVEAPLGVGGREVLSAGARQKGEVAVSGRGAIIEDSSYQGKGMAGMYTAQGSAGSSSICGRRPPRHGRAHMFMSACRCTVHATTGRCWQCGRPMSAGLGQMHV